MACIADILHLDIAEYHDDIRLQAALRYQATRVAEIPSRLGGPESTGIQQTGFRPAQATRPVSQGVQHTYARAKQYEVSNGE